MLRIKQTEGSSSEYCYVDDIEICYENTWEPEEPEYELGDVNGDGAINISDVTALINYLLTKDPSTIVMEAADLNGDQNVNISDATALINRLLTGQATPQ